MTSSTRLTNATNLSETSQTSPFPEQGGEQMMLRAIRGATTVTSDTPENIQKGVIELFDALIEQNALNPDHIVTINVSITDDLHSESPARVVRTHYQWAYTPFFSGIEPDIAGMPERCIRFLILLYSPLPKSRMQHVYLHQAALLRPDISQAASV